MEMRTSVYLHIVHQMPHPNSNYHHNSNHHHRPAIVLPQQMPEDSLLVDIDTAARQNDRIAHDRAHDRVHVLVWGILEVLILLILIGRANLDSNTLVKPRTHIGKIPCLQSPSEVLEFLKQVHVVIRDLPHQVGGCLQQLIRIAAPIVDNGAAEFRPIPQRDVYLSDDLHQLFRLKCIGLFVNDHEVGSLRSDLAQHSMVIWWALRYGEVVITRWSRK